MNYRRVLFCVIASFDEPVYMDFIKMRKLEFKKYGLNNIWIFDEPMNFYEGDENDRFISSPPPYPINNITNPHINPKMILKFLKVMRPRYVEPATLNEERVREIQLDQYDFIVRLNLSTYIDFKTFNQTLSRLPKEKVISGFTDNFPLPDWYRYRDIPLNFVSGTCMIFSRDVIEYLNTYSLDDPILYEHNDDTVLSHICKIYTHKVITQPMKWITKDEDKLEVPSSGIVRIKHESNRQNDVIRWSKLLKSQDNIVYYRETVLPRLFLFWTGPNPLTETRRRAIDDIERVTGLKPILITMDNLHEWILRESPLHPAYEYLSYTHRADFLRLYFMRFYGGAYADIKQQTGSWLPSLRKLNSDPNCMAVGYQEIKGGVALVADKELCEQMNMNYEKLIGNGAYIFKPGTPLTKIWYDETLKVLDVKLNNLKNHPAKDSRDYYMKNGSKYPIGWSEILGTIFHPLVWQFKNRIAQGLPTPSFTNYL